MVSWKRSARRGEVNWWRVKGKKEGFDSGGFFFSSKRRHTGFVRDWSSDVCSSDLPCVTKQVPIVGYYQRDRAHGP